MTMAMSRRISGSILSALLILAVTFAPTAHALDIVNNQSYKLTVFAPPICKPCTCPMIFCIRAPCIQMCDCPQVSCQVGKPCVQPDCVCSLECKFLPGVIVEVGATVTLSVETFPLAFLTVEVNGVAYIVKAADLKCITQSATVVVTKKSCGEGKTGIVALVYSNPKKYKQICLVLGKRYGS